METRSTRVNVKRVKKHQIVLIVNEIEQNRQLNANKPTPDYTAQQRHADWENLTNKLNAAGGAVKTTKAWQKCWSDYKSETKKKLLENKNDMLISEGGQAYTRGFTPLDERVLCIMGLDAVEGKQVPESKSLPSETDPQELQSQPSVSLSWPSVSLSQLSVSLSQPSVSLSQPSVSLSQPSVSKSMPSVSQPQITSEIESDDSRLSSRRKRKRTNLMLVNSEHAKRLVEAQAGVAGAISQVVECLKIKNALNVEELDLKRRKVKAFEGILELKRRKVKVFEDILELLKKKLS